MVWTRLKRIVTFWWSCLILDCCVLQDCLVKLSDFILLCFAGLSGEAVWFYIVVFCRTVWWSCLILDCCVLQDCLVKLSDFGLLCFAGLSGEAVWFWIVVFCRTVWWSCLILDCCVLQDYLVKLSDFGLLCFAGLSGEAVWFRIRQGGRRIADDTALYAVLCGATGEAQFRRYYTISTAVRGIAALV